MPTVKCVHPDTEILLADGRLVRAEALVKEWQVREQLQHDADGDEFSDGEVRIVSLTADGLGGAHATRFWRTPVTDPHVWHVRTRTGRQVIVSARHPFLTPEGWKRAGEVRLGDRVAVARRVRIDGQSQRLPRVRSDQAGADLRALPFDVFSSFSVETQQSIVHRYIAGEALSAIARSLGRSRAAVYRLVRRLGVPMRGQRVFLRPPKQTSPDFWRWMGYFVAEGSLTKSNGSCAIDFANTDEELRSDYVQISTDLFGVAPRPQGISLRFYSIDFAFFLEALGLRLPCSALTKEVPDLLFQCPDHEIAGFLGAYFDGDGTVTADGVHATTKSFRLAHQVQMLLARLGVLAFIRPVWSRVPTRPGRPKSMYAKVSVCGEDVVHFAEKVGFRCHRKQRKLDALVERRRAGRHPSHWDTIPLPPRLFRMVREGLGISHQGSGVPRGVDNIENRGTEPTRRIARHFIELFTAHDRQGRYRDEIAYLRFLASDDIAWDRVDEIRTEAPDVPFFYDLSVEGTECFVGNGVLLHNTHGHSITTGAIKNSFGGLLKEVRHYAHEFIHEVMVDLMYMQRELHPAVLAVMDGTVMGDGAGPRTMIPRIGNLILASADQVAIDAIAAKIMGYDPLGIPYLRMCHERGLGVADPREIEIVGDADAAALNFKFQTSRSLVIWGDQLIRKGPLRPLKRLLLHSPLMVWAPFASNVYHDWLWYPTVGRSRIRAFSDTPWGRLFERY
ncbi:MAG: DUF362 domain-containing protein [Candidatus Rokubacteria bacterium]|nr:DUF362 domain-containing protein [Candidatus Rokubacteria bacterium]